MILCDLSPKSDLSNRHLSSRTETDRWAQSQHLHQCNSREHRHFHQNGWQVDINSMTQCVALLLELPWITLKRYLEMFSCRRSPESPWSPENGSGRVSLGRPWIDRKSTKPPRICFKAMKLWRCIRFQDSTHLGNLHIAASSTCHNAHGEIRYVWTSFVMWNWPKMPLQW